MADTKISALTELTQPVSGDFLAIVDTSAGATKKLDWDAIAQGGVNVDAHGATGDGSTNDNDEIDAAITAAGTDGIVRFTAGKTYIIDRVLTPLAGQIWIGYGATLKKADMVSTLLTGTPTGSVWPVTAGEGTNFRVGSEVAIWDTPDETDHATQVREVVSVTANTITLNAGSFTGITAASGDQLETASRIISSADVDVKIIGLTIDGNGTDYSAGLHSWELHEDIRLTGHRSLVKDVNFIDSQCEALLMAGDGSKAVNNNFVTVGGNAIHVSTSNGAIIEGNYFYDTQAYNLDTSNHQSGAISLSNGVVDLSVSGNYLDGNDSSLAFLGGISETTQGLKISGNGAKDTTTAAIEAIGSFGAVSANHVVTGNIFDNCVVFSFNDTSGNKRVENLTISNNIINDTLFAIDNVAGFTISGNTIDFSGVAGNAFQILDSDNGVISSNAIVTGGSVIGVAINSGGAGLTNNIKIDGNLFTGHTGSSNLIDVLATGANATDVAITNNMIVGGTNINNVKAITVRNDFTEVSGNYVDWRGVTGGSNIAVHFRNDGTDGTARNNYIRHLVTENSLVFVGGHDRATVIGNHCVGLSHVESEEAYVAGNYFEDDALMTGSDMTIVSNHVKDGYMRITGDTNFVNGNRVHSSNAADTIELISGDANVVTNNATTGAITLGTATNTVQTSQNHTL